MILSLLIVIILLVAVAVYLIYRFRRHEKEAKITTDNDLDANYSNYETIEYKGIKKPEQYADVALNPDYLEILPSNDMIESNTNYLEIL